jgi:hypothetical protein
MRAERYAMVMMLTGLTVVWGGLLFVAAGFVLK